MSFDLHISPSDVLRQAQAQGRTFELRRAASHGLTTGDKGTDRELKGLAVEFEKILLSQMMKSMRDTVKTDGLFGQSFGGKMYQEMLDSAIIGKSGDSVSLGLADSLYRQFIELQTGGRASAEAPNQPEGDRHVNMDI